MSKETFAVKCGGIGFHNGVVMLDFMGFSTTEKDGEGRPLTVMAHRVIMTPDALVDTFNTMQGMMNKLLEVGILQKREGAAPSDPGTPQSPNFSPKPS